MLFKRYKSEGLAHYSYLVGDQDRAAVIDPRRDCGVYLRTATAEGLRITHVLETHRNEDYVTGSVELADRTGALVLHSAHDDLTYGYGESIRDGEIIELGRLRLQALHTPGHTLGHMSYLLYDFHGAPWVIFAGDTLFAGEVGRTDFYGPENLIKMTGLLYESIFEKILPLGDGIIVCPAHGAGSVCGSGIAERVWTTIGLEREHNPRLQYTKRDEFVERAAQMLERAPYFARMEKLNVAGPPILGALPVPTALAPGEFAKLAETAQVIDVRDLLSYSTAHVPGSLALWEDELPTYAGWFLSYERPLLLVGDGESIERSARYLIRQGFDQIEGFLGGGLLAWHKAGHASSRIDTITVQELCQFLDQDQQVWILDVRSEQEVQANPIPGAHNVPIKEIPERMRDVPTDLPVYVFCGTGVRSTIAASLLRGSGWRNVTVVLGGLSSWNSVSCPLPLG